LTFSSTASFVVLLLPEVNLLFVKNVSAGFAFNYLFNGFLIRRTRQEQHTTRFPKYV